MARTTRRREPSEIVNPHKSSKKKDRRSNRKSTKQRIKEIDYTMGLCMKCRRNTTFKIEEKVGCDLEDDNKLTSSENLEFVLNRNIYGKKEPELEQLKMLAEYVRDTQNMLATSIGNSLKSGNVTFPSAPGER